MVRSCFYTLILFALIGFSGQLSAQPRANLCGQKVLAKKGGPLINERPIHNQCFGNCYMESSVSVIESMIDKENYFVSRSLLMLQVLEKRFVDKLHKAYEETNKMVSAYTGKSYLDIIVSGGMIDSFFEKVLGDEPYILPIVDTSQLSLARDVDDANIRRIDQAVEAWVKENPTSVTALTLAQRESFSELIAKLRSEVAQDLESKMSADLTHYKVTSSGYIDMNIMTMDRLTPKQILEEQLNHIKRSFNSGRAIIVTFVVPASMYKERVRSLGPLAVNLARKLRWYESGIDSKKRLAIGAHTVQVTGIESDSEGNLIGVYYRNSWGEDFGDKGQGYLDLDFIKKYLLDSYSFLSFELEETELFSPASEPEENLGLRQIQRIFREPLE